jgi:alpha-galactosidase
MAGTAEGESLCPENLNLMSEQVLHAADQVDKLRLTYKHRLLPLQIVVQYSAWGDTGVFSRQVTVVNKGEKVLRIESLPPLSLELPSGRYDLSYLWGGWSHEWQLTTEELSAGEKSFVSTRGRSTNGYSSWFCLHNKNRGARYLAQLAYSGNWEMKFERYPDRLSLEKENLRVSLGMRPDFGGPLALAPGESFALPLVAFTATPGSLDDGANQLHRYQRRFVVPRTRTNEPLLVQFNTAYPFPEEMKIDQLKQSANVAARLGAEVFVLDAGWFSDKSYDRELGD